MDNTTTRISVSIASLDTVIVVWKMLSMHRSRNFKAKRRRSTSYSKRQLLINSLYWNQMEGFMEQRLELCLLSFVGIVLFGFATSMKSLIQESESLYCSIPRLLSFGGQSMGGGLKWNGVLFVCPNDGRHTNPQ